MSRDKRLEPRASAVQETTRPQYRTDEALPVTLRDADLMVVLGLKRSGFYKRKARGDYRFLELTPQLPDSNTLYSGHLVTLWLRGEVPVRRVFGRGTEAIRAARRSGRPRTSDVAREAV